MPLATLTYNSITLAQIRTLNVAQSPVKDPSGADTLYFKLRVTVASAFNPDMLPATPYDPVDLLDVPEPPAKLMKRVRHMLLSPRKSFVFDPTGDNLIAVGPEDDEANGPFPVSCDIVQITPQTWDIKYTVDVHIRDCASGYVVRPWLSLRWSDSISYNRDWFAVRRRSGTLILSSADPTGPEAYRGLVTPDVPRGFRRNSAEYTLSEDNLKVSFRFEDVQLSGDVPKPAIKRAGRMIVSTPLPGAQRRGELHLRLSGPSTVDKKELLALAIAIGMGRVERTNIVRSERTGRTLIGGSVEEDFDDERNEIALTLQWVIVPNSKRTVVGAAVGGIAGAVAGAAGGSGLQLGGGFDWVGTALVGSADEPDRTRGIGPPTRGTADTVRLVAAALNDPCGQDPVASEIATVNESVQVDDEGTTLRVSTLSSGGIAADDLSSTELVYSDDEGDYVLDGPGTYEVYEITSHYEDETGVEMAASTKPGGEARELQYHSGIRRLTVEFSATKIGSPPTIPDPKPDDPNVVYLGGKISPSGMDLAADGTSPQFTVSGVYRYAFRDASKVVISAPIPPWLSRSLARLAGEAAGQMSKDIVFPTAEGANPFDGTGTTTASIADDAVGAGGDWGPTTGDPQGQTIYP